MGIWPQDQEGMPCPLIASTRHGFNLDEIRNLTFQVEFHFFAVHDG